MVRSSKGSTRLGISGIPGGRRLSIALGNPRRVREARRRKSRRRRPKRRTRRRRPRRLRP